MPRPRRCTCPAAASATAKHTTNGSVTLDDTTSPHFADWSGVNNNYGKHHVQRHRPSTTGCQANIAYPGDPNASLNARVRLILVDPKGRMAAHSLPAGRRQRRLRRRPLPDPGHVDGRHLQPNQHRRRHRPATVLFTQSTENTTGFGSVSPSVAAPGPRPDRHGHGHGETPDQPGDTSGSVVLDAGNGNQTSVPVVLRSLIGRRHGNGSFHGTLTGGNGRPRPPGQENFYQFDVPAGVHNVSAGVDLTNDATDNAVAYLVDPQGEVVAVQHEPVDHRVQPGHRCRQPVPVTQTDVYASNPRRAGGRCW